MSKDEVEYDCAATYHIEGEEKQGLAVSVYDNEFFEGKAFTFNI